MTLPETITIETERLQALFDMAVSSMDFSSGFLDTDEVNHLRAVAVILGVDPGEATPIEFISQYPHPFKVHDKKVDACIESWRCGKPAADPIHQCAEPEVTL